MAAVCPKDYRQFRILSAIQKKKGRAIYVIELLSIINSEFFSVYFLYLPIKHVKHEMLNSLTKMGQSICATVVQLG